MRMIFRDGSSDRRGCYNPAMPRWLLKTEPSEYSFEDLTKAKNATWDGVANAVALKNIRAMAVGDDLLIYHTGDEKAVVGLAKVTSKPYPDPKDPAGKLTVIDIKAVKKLKTPVSLATIKVDPVFAGRDLLRIGRLSVVPVPDAMWERIIDLSDGEPQD
jgi:predicted RNA-binding protein with PUA-like domain